MPTVWILALAAAAAAEAVHQPPSTPKKPVTDTYHGVAVVDDYRWLEDWNDPNVKAWSEAQNAAARAYLDALMHIGAIKARAEQIMTAPSVRHSSMRLAESGGKRRLLGMRKESSRQQPLLVCFDDADSILAGAGDATLPRTVFDPALEKGASIDWYEPSPDGELVAVSVSLAGSEAGDVRVLKIADGSRVGEIVPRVNGGTAGGSLAWTPDSKGFYYTRYPRAGERPEADLAFYTQVYFHVLGTDTKDDRYEIGKDFPKIAEILLESDAAGAVLARVQNGDGGEFVHLYRDPAGKKWTQLDRYEDRNVQAALGADSDGRRAIYLISRKDAPRGKLLRLDIPTDPAKPVRLADAKVVIPEQSDTLVSEFADASNLCITDTAIYAAYQLGGPSEIRAFDHAGKPLIKPMLPPVAAVGGLTRIRGDGVIFEYNTFVEPTTWLAYSAREDKPNPRRLSVLCTQSPVDFSGFEVVREMATSLDDTRVPVNIVRRRGLKLDGSHPCRVTGYGGYNISIEPRFNPADMLLLEQGFVLATANIRGGGEFGDAWHLAGNLTNKQNVFDDFAAACQHMIRAGYTRSDKLCIEGGSNGGLLMGAMITQHPDWFAAVVSHVGIYDMLRVELSSNGAFNIPEFGSVKYPEHFRAMYAYSPYHNVKDEAPFPATLFMTGANDPRVDPMQSRKMTARLQAATSADPKHTPILLRTSGDTGHGAGTPLSERIAQTADGAAFLMDRLGVEWKKP